MQARLPGLLLALVAAAGCGRSPTSPDAATTAPAGRDTVTAVVFHDENANGRLDPGENTRIPDALVLVSGRQGQAEPVTGLAHVAGLPDGSLTLSVQPDSLPPYYVGPPPFLVQTPLPAGAIVEVPVRLPIGPRSRPAVYMAFGDSITVGDGASSEGATWPRRLEATLAARFGRAGVENQGIDAARTGDGVRRIGRALAAVAPAFTLILLGTNDWHDPRCQDQPDCVTVPNLRSIVRQVRDFGSLPVIATILPTDPSVNAGRNDWVRAENDLIRAMAREENVLVADPYQAFARQPNLPSLFSSDVHPDDTGYALVANAFADALSHGHVGALSTHN